MINYTLVRSRRRTAAIYIKDGGVEVRAPLKMPKRDVDGFVGSKEKWISERLAESRLNAARREAFALNYGDTVTFRGAELPLAAKTGKKAGFDGERFYLPPGLLPEQIKPVVVQIYRRLAKLYITGRVEHYAGLMKVSPSAIRINGAMSRWGSCSARIKAGETQAPSLNFSWRLIMADDEVIDYVVVHELAHIAEMNHSARFWAIVKDVLPYYKERRKRLKELQKRLNTEDWG